MIGHSLKNMFDSLGFAYDFAFCQNKWSLKIFQNVLWKMPFNNDKIYQSFWVGGGYKKYQKQNSKSDLSFVQESKSAYIVGIYGP